MTAPVAVRRRTPSGIRWNDDLGRYIDTNGRIVSTATVRRELDRSIDRMKQDARTLADELRGGRVSLAEWEKEMRVLVKDVQLLSVAGARGGWGQLGASEYGRIGAFTRQQYDYLYQFALDVQSGKQRLDGTLSNRAVMYVESGRRSFEKQQQVTDAAAGYDQERNVLHPADHCSGPTGCPAQTARGWVPIGALVPIGERPCRSRCKCTIDRRRSPAARVRARRRRANAG